MPTDPKLCTTSTGARDDQVLEEHDSREDALDLQGPSLLIVEVRPRLLQAQRRERQDGEHDHECAGSGESQRVPPSALCQLPHQDHRSEHGREELGRDTDAER